MKHRRKFTIWHGIILSLALHSALAAPFFVRGFLAVPDEPPLLVIDLQGVIADSQTEQKQMEEVKNAVNQQDPSPVAEPTPAPPPSEDPQKEVTEQGDTAASPPQAQNQPAPTVTPELKSVDAGPQNAKGAEDKQIARTIDNHDTEKDRLSDYVKLLSKKIRSNLVYPAGGRRAAATVSFSILSNGQIQPGSLKIVESSGQEILDSSALKTIRASLPFPPPPQEMTVAITVDFDRKR